MKKHCRRIAVLLIMSLSLCRFLMAGGRFDVQRVDATGNAGLYSSIAVDRSNSPNISYYDSTNDLIKYAYWNGSKWNVNPLTTPGPASGSGSGT